MIARTMHARSLAAATRLAHDGPFDDVRRLLDVGGGSGCFSIALALRHPRIRCTILELPQMCAVAREYAATAGVTDRVDPIAADMFRDEWPGEHDAVLFSNVLHDWRPETAAWLLRQAFQVPPSGGRVFVHEMLLDDDGDGPLAAASFSLAMLQATQGQQFTRERAPRLALGSRIRPSGRAANRGELLARMGATSVTAAVALPGRRGAAAAATCPDGPRYGIRM